MYRMAVQFTGRASIPAVLSEMTLAKDPRAVEVITSMLPEGVLTADDIVRQTTYISFLFTMRDAFKQHMRPKMPQLDDAQAEALLQRICAELGKIDITDSRQIYKETEVF